MLRRPRPGDTLDRSAESFNTIIDAVYAFQRRQHNQERHPTRDFRQTGIVLMRNDSGAACPRFGVLGIDGPLITPTQNENEFANRVALKGVTPTALHAGRFGVLMEPAAAGAIVRAYIVGICPARVKVENIGHGFVDIAPDMADYLATCEAGAGRLLWRDAESGVTWAIVALSAGAGGATAPAYQWAKIVAISPLIAQLVDESGTPDGDDKLVYVYAGSTAGYAQITSFTDFSPKLTIGAYVWIQYLPSAGTGRPAGWWLMGPSGWRTAVCPT